MTMKNETKIKMQTRIDCMIENRRERTNEFFDKIVRAIRYEQKMTNDTCDVHKIELKNMIDAC